MAWQAIFCVLLAFKINEYVWEKILSFPVLSVLCCASLSNNNCNNFKHKIIQTCFFGALNNGANVMSANISKSHCMINLNTLLPYILASERETPTNAYSIRLGAK